MVRIVLFLGRTGVDHVDFFGFDDAVGLGLHFFPEALLGNVEEAITLGIDALYEFRKISGPAITTGQRAQCKGWRRHIELCWGFLMNGKSVLEFLDDATHGLLRGRKLLHIPVEMLSSFLLKWLVWEVPIESRQLLLVVDLSKAEPVYQPCVKRCQQTRWTAKNSGSGAHCTLAGSCYSGYSGHSGHSGP